MNQTRILVVEDSPLIRQILVDMLRREPDFEVVGFARDGEEALLRIAELSPDVVTLDLDMPRMDGIECLREVMAIRPIPMVMISTLTPAWADLTIEALSLGAFDVICKPENGSISTLRGIREELVEKVRNAGRATIHQDFRPVVQASKAKPTEGVVTIAAGSGGPRALAELFRGLPQHFAASVVISQPTPPPFTESLAHHLSQMGAMPVRVAQAGAPIQPGVALLVPGGQGMTVEADGSIVLSDTPSADALFESVAKAFGSRCIAAILTGAGSDGAKGALAIRRAGGTVFAESLETCAIYGMGLAAVEAGAVDRSWPLDEMGENIAQAIENLPAIPKAA